MALSLCTGLMASVVGAEIHVYVMGDKEKNMLPGMEKLADSLSKKYSDLRFTIGELNNNEFSNFDSIETADVIMFNLRRKSIKQEQMDKIKELMTGDKPVIGLRRASHAFNNWSEVDKELLGGAYNNHAPSNTLTEFEIVDSVSNHPILDDVEPYTSSAYVYYQNASHGMAEDAKVLLMGWEKGKDNPNKHPVAWVRENYNGKRIFYTSLFGTHKNVEYSDYRNPNFHKMMANAIYWVTETPVSLKHNKFYSRQSFVPPSNLKPELKLNSKEFGKTAPNSVSISGKSE